MKAYSFVRSMCSASLLLAALVLSSTPSSAWAGGTHTGQAAAHPGLEKLKALAGDWLMEGGDASVAVTYRVTAGGSAVLETLFPGSPHEMVTLYTAQGDQLHLTHYCGAGNQPQMKAAPSKDGNRYDFQFTGGSNLDPKKDGHMHDAAITFIDADHVQSEWTYWEKGARQETKAFKLARKK